MTTASVAFQELLHQDFVEAAASTPIQAFGLPTPKKRSDPLRIACHAAMLPNLGRLLLVKGHTRVTARIWIATGMLQMPHLL